MSDHRSRARILDVREERKALNRFEFREDAGTGELILQGYAATFTPYDAFGGPERGGWVETLARNAFDQTLRADPDVQLLLNHEGLPLARTKSGTLKLDVDAHGLRILARLDPTDPDVQGLAPKMRRGDIDEMSFAFRVKDQVWDDNYTNRTITEVSLHKGDVSVVNYGMNPGTRAVLEQGVEAMASLSAKDLVELRRLDPDLMHRAKLALMTVNEARAWRADAEHSDLTEDGQCPECASQGEGQSATHFADPGHLGLSRQQAGDGDGVRRFPIDAQHVVASFTALSAPQAGYTPTQLEQIRKRCAEAMRKHGHQVPGVQTGGTQRAPDPKAADNLLAGVSHLDMVRNVDGGTTLVAVMTDGSRTPLPSMQVSSPAPGDARLGGMFPVWQVSSPAPGDARLGGMFPYVWADGARTHGQREADESDTEENAEGENPFAGDDEEDPEEDRAFDGKKAAPFAPGGGRDPESENNAEGEERLSFDAGPINVTRALGEFRDKTGIPSIANISEGLAYLKRA
jgi:HK97 family phage prohead protease